MRKLVLLTTVLLMVSGCATNLATIKIDPNSERSLIVLEIDSLPKGASLIYQTYDEGNRQIVHGPRTGTFMSENYYRSGKYLFTTIRSGKYVLSSVSLQLNWVLCLNDRTISFDVKPGEVVYLGRFDARPQLAKINSRFAGSISFNSQKFYAFDEGVPPVIEPPSLGEMAALQSHLKVHFQNISAPLRAGDTKYVQFETGMNMLHTQRVCG